MRKVLYIFGLLTDEDIAWMAQVGQRRRLKEGEVVITEGQPTGSIFLLLEGELLVSAGRFGQIARLGVGEIVGEVSLVDSAPPSATITVVRECLALFIDKTTLIRRLETDAAFGCRFYRALAIFLADRLRATLRLPSRDERGIGEEETILRDEVDSGILDTLSAAGERFNRLLKILRGPQI